MYHSNSNSSNFSSLFFPGKIKTHLLNLITDKCLFTDKTILTKKRWHKNCELKGCLLQRKAERFGPVKTWENTTERGTCQSLLMKGGCQRMFPGSSWWCQAIRKAAVSRNRCTSLLWGWMNSETDCQMTPEWSLPTMQWFCGVCHVVQPEHKISEYFCLHRTQFYKTLSVKIFANLKGKK